MTGIILMTTAMATMYFLPIDVLTISITRLPILGNVPVVGLILMLAGISWALININSLPMVVDMTTAARLGTYTGLYYLASTLAAITGPNINGWIIQLGGRNYNTIMLVAPAFMLVALFLISGVKRGEASQVVEPVTAG